MASEWRDMTLREAGVLLFDCDHRTPAAVEDGVPYVAIPQLQDGRIKLSEARRISAEDFVEWTRKTRPTVGDIVLSRRCNPGETAVVSADARFALGQNLVLLRADGSSSDAGFLRWAVRGPQWWEQISKFINVGAVFESLRCKDIPEFTLSFPPIKVQREIACVLDSIDSKIQLLHGQNETLEGIARTIFQSWFVNFDPVRAKVEGREPEGIDAATAALFPGRFASSQRDALPEGWTATPLYEIASFSNGAAYRDIHFSRETEGLPVIKIAELKAGVTSSTKFTESDLGERHRIEQDEVLFSWSGNPDTSIDTFIWNGGPAWLNQHIFRVRANGVVPRSWIYVQLKSLRPTFAEIARDKQTTGLGHVTIADMKRLMVCKPSAEVTVRFDELVKPILERVAANQLNGRTLKAIRDTLLPRLISGKLRIADAEELVEAVL
jgi:type I restriction enzyme, S subunit